MEGNKHATQTHNSTCQKLVPSCHLQVLYDECRKQTNDKVSQGCDSTAQICNVDDDLQVLAFAGLVQAMPKVLDGLALEHGEEEEECSSRDDERHDGKENALMDAIDCDAE